MKKTITFLLSFAILFLLLSCNVEYDKKIEQPKTLDMELVCVTPHGHQVYRYYDNWSNQFAPTTVYVIIRHSDGMPLGISTQAVY